MAFRHGKNAQFFIGSTELTSYLNSADMSIDVDTAEVTTFGKGWKEYLSGLIGAGINLAGSYDGTTGTGPIATLNAVVTGGTPWAMKYFPGGSATGQRQDSFSGFVTNMSESSPVGDAVSFSATVLPSGTVTSTTL